MCRVFALTSEHIVRVTACCLIGYIGGGSSPGPDFELKPWLLPGCPASVLWQIVTDDSCGRICQVGKAYAAGHVHISQGGSDMLRLLKAKIQPDC